ncbi:MAG TPA: cytosine deaminase [Xanthobacteraceae bacterium]|nr:cytosine deaminase [Xanthobacteraceae bacterium]
MPSSITISPNLARFRLANARAPVCLIADAAQLSPDADGLAPCDIVVEGERIAQIAPSAVTHDGLPRFDLDHGIVLPRLVDVHTHIDKGHIWQRAQNPNGTHAGARAAVMADREKCWSRADVAKRMDFTLRCAFAHGTGALRTHIDSYPKQTPISWPLFAEMREHWKGRIALQAVSLCPIDVVNDADVFRNLVATVVKHGGILGGLTFMGEAPNAKTDAMLDKVFAAASANGLDLDFHVDESDSPLARSLRQIAEAALRHKFKGRIVAGHCCALALAPDDEREAIIAKVAQAGIAVVSLPMCNMYLQDRVGGRTPRWRGVAPLHELDAAGVSVMVASDNTRDPFYAYGDLDMIEVFREATRILHFDHSARPWLRAAAATPGSVMGLPHGVIAVGAPAGLILTRARTMNELLARPQADRVVLCAGKQVDRTLPDYRELD